MAEKEIPYLAAEVFSTNAGQKFLQYLRIKTIEAPSFSVGSGDGMSCALVLARRSGENDLVKHIEKLIEKGQKNDR